MGKKQPEIQMKSAKAMFVKAQKIFNHTKEFGTRAWQSLARKKIAVIQ
jgi:hypothetical protein